MKMGYDRMDHAGWVQENIGYAKRWKPTPAEAKAAKSGRGWHGAPDVLNPFQRRVFNMLGVVGGGIYNAPIHWGSVEWRSNFLVVNWPYELATRDFRGLTDLVFLAHDAGIRVAISPNMRSLQLIFHSRERPPEGGSACKGHSTLEDAVSDHRKRFPADHPIHLENDPRPVDPAVVCPCGDNDGNFCSLEGCPFPKPRAEGGSNA